jgi:hypothetical protein
VIPSRSRRTISGRWSARFPVFHDLARRADQYGHHTTEPRRRSDHHGE